MDNRQGWSTQKTSNNAVSRLSQNHDFIIRLSRKIGDIATGRSVVYGKGYFFDRQKSSASSETPSEAFISKSAPSKRKIPLENSVKESEQSLKTAAYRSHETLMTANTVFPITLFPDTVTVDRTKVTITRRDFFWSSNVLSIRIEDVLNVQVSVGPFFGSLTIASRVMSTVDHFQINHLWRLDAVRLKRIIQGYVIAQHNNISTAHLDKNSLVETLIELGHDTND